jgi:hypothetical protein
MSTTYKAIAFFGLYLGSIGEVEAFLKKNNAEYDSDDFDADNENALVLSYLEENSYMLGFAIKAGVSDSYARERWEHRIGHPSETGKPKSYLDVVSY